MTSYKDALVLLNDLEEFADNYELAEAENLIAKARLALAKDLGNEFPSVRKSQRVSQIYLDQ